MKNIDSKNFSNHIMRIRIYKGKSGCLASKGIAIVIDVFRATTTLCCLLESKAKEIIVVPDIKPMENYINDENYITFSEIKSYRAIYDNSPLTALNVSLKGKKAVLLTQNGTLAFNLVKHCDRVFAASFVNLDAIVKYIKNLNPKFVSIIAIGHINRNEETLEDNLCAEAIRARLCDEDINEYYIRKQLALRIKERKKDIESPQGDRVDKDIALCTAIGIFNTIPEIIYKNGIMRAINVLRQGKSYEN